MNEQSQVNKKKGHHQHKSSKLKYDKENVRQQPTPKPKEYEEIEY
jgi:hypothetical protein